MSMKRLTRWLAVGAVPIALAGLMAADTPGPIPKARIERPVKDVVAKAAPAPPPAANPQPIPEKPAESPAEQGERRALEAELKQIVTPKDKIEGPVKGAVAKATLTPPATPTENPTVEAGVVKWHKTLEDAQAAAKKSGKPVLLFQMMGYLDKKFC